MKKPHKHAEVIKAWAEGEEIQFFYDEQWMDLPKSMVPTFSEKIEYRVKPKPKLKPYDSVSEMASIVGKRLIAKGVPFSMHLCTDLHTRSNGVYTVIVNGSNYTTHQLLEHFTFEDRSPCGKTVVE